MFDIIGDIHGHAAELLELLAQLGYRPTNGVHRHSDRRAIFLGDFIDRGPQIRQVLETVRPMVDSGYALAVMGNHELNALAYHTEDPDTPGKYLRPHVLKNDNQHRATVEQLTPAELRSALEWFRTLPLWLDLDGLRVVHACWDPLAIAAIANGLGEHDGVTTEFLLSACRRGQALFDSVDVTLKGKEADLPPGLAFHDKDGHERTAVRARWYMSPHGQTYRTYALQSDPINCDVALEPGVIEAAVPYPAQGKPVFFGHYWLRAERPELLAENVACVDYSVAKGGALCAYRWQGEHSLTNDHFVWVAARR